MRFKNITKKNIIILSNGTKQVIKPKQIVEGDKAILGQYSGLLKINKVGRGFNEIQPTKEHQSDLLHIEIEEIIIDEKTETNLRRLSDISIDFIIVDDLT